MILRLVMKWKLPMLATLLVLLFSLQGREAPNEADSPPPERKIPLYFEENRGQAPPGVQMVGRDAGNAIFLEMKGIFFSSPLFSGKEERPGILFKGNTGGAGAAPRDPLPGRSNYYRSRGPEGWIEGVPHYAKAFYRGLYPGIDLLLREGEKGWEYDFILHPGSDLKDILIGISGATSIHLDERGALAMVTPGGTITHHAPLIYQERGGKKIFVVGKYLVSGAGLVSFAVGPYDRSRDLVIDPEISFSTFLGGTSTDEGFSLFVDGNGESYVTGRTASTDFPTQSPTQPGSGGGDDVFVSRFDSSGNTLLFSTYFGGAGSDRGRAISVDSTGNIYVAGTTSSSDFPLQNEFQSSLSGPSDAFLFTMNPGGTLLFSTYYGGSGSEDALGLKVNSAQEAFVTGFTSSSDLTTVNAFQGSFGGGAEDAFVAKIDTAAMALVFGSYLGGAGADRGNGIAIDSSDRMYIAGTTSSTDFPVKNAFQGSSGGLNDAFVTKVDLAFSGALAHIFSTYLGGTGNDRGKGIALDSAGAPYVTGSTSSSDFPLQNPFQPSPAGGFDAFLFKMAADGSSLTYSTYLGGGGFDEGFAVTVSSKKEAYVTGETTSSDFPLVNPVQTSNAGSDDIFVTQVRSSGDGLIFSTYVGGGSFDSGKDVALDSSGNIYVGGLTDSSDFPADAFDTTIDGRDGFLLKIREKAVIKRFDVVSGCTVRKSPEK